MKKTKVYLDSSVINHLFHDDTPERMQITNIFFNFFVKTKVFDVFISPVVIDEISATPDENRRNKLLSVITDYSINVLNFTDSIEEIDFLADSYINQGILPKKSKVDALHIAIATFYQIDVLLSWNYKHMANIDKERKVVSSNLSQGYTHNLRICTPMEAIYENE